MRWFSFIWTHIHSLSGSFLIEIITEYWESSLCYTASHHWPIIPYTLLCICHSQTLSPFSHHPPTCPLLSLSFSKSVSLFLFCKEVHFYLFFKTTYRRYHDICILLSNLVWESLLASMLCRWHYFVLFCLISILLYICTTSS